MPGNNQVKKLAAKVAVKVPHPDSVVEVRVMPPESNFEIKVTPGSDVIELRIQPGSSLIELRITPPEQIEGAQKEIIEVKPEEAEEKVASAKADSIGKESFHLPEEIKHILETGGEKPDQETKATKDPSAIDLEGVDFLMEDRPGPEHSFFEDKQKTKAQSEDVTAEEIPELIKPAPSAGTMEIPDLSAELPQSSELTEETQHTVLNECSGDLLEVPAAATNYHTRICPALPEEDSQTSESVSFDEFAFPTDQTENKSGNLAPESTFNTDKALANEETNSLEQQEPIKAEPEDNAPIDLQCEQPETINCNLMPKNWQPALVEESQLAEDQSISEDSLLPDANTIPAESSLVGGYPSLDANGITSEDSEAEGVEQIDVPKEKQIASKSELLEDINSVTAAEEEQFLEKKMATEPDMPLNELPDTSEQLSGENVMDFFEESITENENSPGKADEVNDSETSSLPIDEVSEAGTEGEEFHSAELDEAAKAALARLSAAVSDETSFLSSNTVLTTSTAETQELLVEDNAKIDVTTIIPEASSIAQKAREEAAEKALERMVFQENENAESELESKAHDLPPTPPPAPPIKKEPRRSLHVTPREAVTAVLVEILSDSDPHLVDVDDEPLPEEEQMDLSYIYDDDNADDALDIDTIDVSNLSLDLEKSDIQSISAPTVIKAKPLQKADN